MVSDELRIDRAPLSVKIDLDCKVLPSSRSELSESMVISSDADSEAETLGS